MKRIKKLITVLTVCTLLFTFTACSKATAVGSWKKDESVKVTSPLPKFYPDELVFNEDDTGSANGYADFTWEVKQGNISINFGDTFGTYSYAYELKDEKLYLDDYCYVKQ